MAEKKKKAQSADLDGRRAVIYARYSPGPNKASRGK